MSLLAAAAALAVTPDLDILVGAHRAHTHSVAAVAVVGLASWLVLRRRSTHALALSFALAAAFGSHLLLDLLGKDTRNPRGLTALWPFSSDYYVTGWDVFSEVSRRYWLPGEFVVGNLRAVAWELVLLGPVLLVAWAFWSRRTLGRHLP
jgi:inner membrane protein